MTQEQVALELAIPRTTIETWESGNIRNDGIVKANTPPPDWWVKLSTESKEELIQRHYEDELQQRLADDFKISPGRVSQIIAAYEKQQAKAMNVSPQRALTATQIKGWRSVNFFW